MWLYGHNYWTELSWVLQTIIRSIILWLSKLMIETWMIVSYPIRSPSMWEQWLHFVFPTQFSLGLFQELFPNFLLKTIEWYSLNGSPFWTKPQHKCAVTWWFLWWLAVRVASWWTGFWTPGACPFCYYQSAFYCQGWVDSPSFIATLWVPDDVCTCQIYPQKEKFAI